MQVSIKTTHELVSAIENAIAATTPEGRYEFVYAIAKYKWYNYYMNLHVKHGSIKDQANEIIFEGLKNVYPTIHVEIEEFIQKDIDKYNLEFDD